MAHQSMFADWLWANWRGLLWSANAAWWASELWIFARDWRRVQGQRADRFSRALIIGAIGISLAAAQAAQVAAPFARLPDGDIGAVRFFGGVVLMWLGIGLRQWAVATLGRFFRTSVVVQEDHALVTHGLYRRLRNPSYTGLMITVLGQGLIYGNWLALVVVVGGIGAALAWRIHVETQALRGRFGAEWDTYAAHSWALIPFVW